jgi:predicted HTH domain antitoxin
MSEMKEKNIAIAIEYIEGKKKGDKDVSLSKTSRKYGMTSQNLQGIVQRYRISQIK